jgi:class 3 adenylate cyclase/tetratricopeptide (TPR) repeat protein
MTIGPSTLLENLSSYVPQLIARYVAANPTPLTDPVSDRFPSAVLFADISGFTHLTESLAQDGPEGVENLSNLLNAYFGQLIDIVIDHDGDIVEFTGDGIIALWPTPVCDEDLPTVVLRAARCGLDVQQGLAAFGTVEPLNLSLRVSIGAGEVLMANVGGILGRWELLVAGDPLVHVSEVLHMAYPGEVVLTADTWHLVREHCTGEVLPGGAARLDAVDVRLPPASPPPTLLLPRMIPTLGSFLPGSILDRLEAGLTDWIAELRYVTILFVNVHGIDYNAPDALEQAHRVMRALQTGLYQYEGSVNQFIFDDKGTIFVAAMGLPPLTHEDDAVRGVQAALAMHAQLRKIGITCAIGMATGSVFCGERGSIRRRDYAMIGGTMNLAARLMQAAEVLDHGSAAPVLCDSATYEVARIRLAFEELPPTLIKGKAEPVRVYRPLGRERAIVRRQTMLIGRAAERQALREHLDMLNRNEHAGVVIIEGEMGMGKSRLIGELQQRAESLGIPALVGLGEAIERATSYHAWRPIFATLLDLDAAPPADNQLARRIRVLNRLWVDPELARLAPLINAVLPLDVPESQITSQMVGQVRADNTRRLLLRLLQAAAAQSPLLLVLDEAHWLDSASWALALAVAREVQPALLIIATRPLIDPMPAEYGHLRQHPGTRCIVLDSLAPDETLRLVEQRLGVERLPEPVGRLVLEKSEGNPFFSEELAYAMRDAGLILIEDGTCRIAPNAGDLSSISFPASVQGVVISRIDRLQPGHQMTLKVASVIGQMFTLSPLRAVYPIEPERPRLPDYLSELEGLNITSLAAHEPDLTYIFKHVIIQEVVYNLLLFAQRRELHRAVAQWYEDTYAADLSAFYSLLAHHWYKAEAYGRAIDYLERAGEQALRVFANQEAVNFFSEILQLVERHSLPGRVPAASATDAETNAEDADLIDLLPTPDTLRRARWERQLGEAYLGLGLLASSRAHLERAVALLRHPVPASRRKWTTRTLRQAIRQTFHRLRASWMSRSSTQERAAALEAARAYEALILIYFYANESLPATYTSLLTLNLAERVGPSSELARAYANMAIATGALALHPLAEAYTQQARATAEQVGELTTTAYVFTNSGLYWVGTGNWQSARLALEQAADICDQLGDRRRWGTSWTLLAQVAYYEGDFARGAEMFEQLHDEAHHSGDVLQQAWALGGQGQNMLRLGQLVRAAELLEQANTALAENRELPSQISNDGLLAMCWLRRGDLSRAHEAARAAAMLLDSVGVPSAYYLIEGYAGVAETYLALWEASGGSAPAERAALAQRAHQACGALAHYARVFPIGKPRMLLCRGLHAWLEGRPRQAHLRWQQGLEAAQRLAMPYEEGLLSYEAGRHTTGHVRHDYLSHAAALFTRMGARSDLERVQAIW